MSVDPLALAAALVRIPSPTGQEGAACSFVADRLERLGWRVIRQPVSDGRCNVYAVRREPVVVLTTHLDTVLPVLPVTEDDDWLAGRGTADAKGIAAAQIAAAARLAASGEDRVALLFVVGEEGPSDGARAAASLTPKGRYIINGEPTENRLALGTKGSIRIELTTRGRAAHSAYPEEGSSAIEAMLAVLERIRGVEFPADRVLGNVTLNIGTIEGGTAPNIVPDACHAQLMYRTVDRNEDVIAALRRTVGNDGEMRVTLSLPPVRLLARAGFDTTVVRFGTDLPFLEPWGERFLLGPGSITVAHTPHERISKAELGSAVDVYERLARILLAEHDA